MIVDLGCGDGRGALALAAAEPRSLVLAVDADARSMAESSRRARKLPGEVVFVAASAEAFARDMPRVADRVVVTFPWGSLLRGVLGSDDGVAGALAAIVRPGACVEVLLSVTGRDGVAGVPALREPVVAQLAAAHARRGLGLVADAPASPAEVRATGSTWGKRLLAGGAERPVWRLVFRRVTG